MSSKDGMICEKDSSASQQGPARVVVAVDGLAGSGKSTISKLLAQKLKFAHLNTGLLYRAVAWLALKYNVSPENGPALESLLAKHSIELFCDDTLSSRVRIDAQDVTSSLQDPLVSETTSRAAAQKEVRQALVAMQRNAFPGYGLVAEGRDMGTVIFKDAQVKFFVQASQEVRVMRRLRQLYGNKIEHLDKDSAEAKDLKSKMEIEIVERDTRDAARSLAPAKPAEDAVIVDNSSLPLDKVVDNMYYAVRECVKADSL